MKFIIDGVKVEFFYPEDPLSQSCLSGVKTNYEESLVQILNVTDIAKLKVKALMDRIKIRDIFDMYEILERSILSEREFFTVAREYTQKDEVWLLNKIFNMTEQKSDESLYFIDDRKIPTFNELKDALYKRLDSHLKNSLIENQEHIMKDLLGR
jgi:predicted nucleotidyltransferase component of viral defense system